MEKPHWCTGLTIKTAGENKWQNIHMRVKQKENKGKGKTVHSSGYKRPNRSKASVLDPAPIRKKKGGQSWNFLGPVERKTSGENDGTDSMAVQGFSFLGHFSELGKNALEYLAQERGRGMSRAKK